MKRVASRAVRALHEARWALNETPRRLALAEKAVRAEPRSPIDEYVYMSYATRSDGLFDGTYDLWRVKRLDKILALYGIDTFAGRTVLELGAGHGDLGAVLASLGASVTCVEGRLENLNFGRLKHRHVANLRFLHADLDEDFRSLGRFDLVLHLGLLYHIEHVEQHLQWCFELTDDLFLESVVCDSTDPHRIHVIDERSWSNEEAISGKGSRPSPFFVERVASEAGFEVERHFSADLNAGAYVYDWTHRDDDDLGSFDRRRFWRFRRTGSQTQGEPS